MRGNINLRRIFTFLAKLILSLSAANPSPSPRTLMLSQALRTSSIETSAGLSDWSRLRPTSSTRSSILLSAASRDAAAVFFPPEVAEAVDSCETQWGRMESWHRTASAGASSEAASTASSASERTPAETWVRALQRCARRSSLCAGPSARPPRGRRPSKSLNTSWKRVRTWSSGSMERGKVRRRTSESSARAASGQSCKMSFKVLRKVEIC